jgi:uncharacterized membrane protein YhhN
MDIIKISLTLVYSAAIILTLIGYWKRERTMRIIGKTLLMPLLAVIYAVFSRQPSIFILSALFFGWIGDVILLGDRNINSIGGLISFAVGHICYCLGMIHSVQGCHPAGYLSVLYILVTVFICWKAAVSHCSGKFRPLGIIYSVFLSSTGASVLYLLFSSGFALPYLICFTGAAMFVVSDCILTREIFLKRTDHGGFAVMLTYIIAQSSLIAGFILRGGI